MRREVCVGLRQHPKVLRLVGLDLHHPVGDLLAHRRQIRAKLLQLLSVGGQPHRPQPHILLLLLDAQLLVLELGGEVVDLHAPEVPLLGLSRGHVRDPRPRSGDFDKAVRPDPEPAQPGGNAA